MFLLHKNSCQGAIPLDPLKGGEGQHGEDRSGIIQGEGKGGAAVEGIGEAGLFSAAASASGRYPQGGGSWVWTGHRDSRASGCYRADQLYASQLQ